jgi:hypothetical protein
VNLRHHSLQIPVPAEQENAGYARQRSGQGFRLIEVAADCLHACRQSSFGLSPKQRSRPLIGINWIDTVAVYSLGHAEEVVAKALAGRANRPYVFTMGARRQDFRDVRITEG